MSEFNALRNYRFQKSSRESSSSNNLVPGRKRIQMMHDSESENEKSSVNVELSIDQKEDLLKSAKKMEPDYSTMSIQDALVHCNWNITKAISYLTNGTFKKRKLEHTSQHSSSHSSTHSSHSSHSPHRHHHHHHTNHHHHSSNNGSHSHRNGSNHSHSSSSTKSKHKSHHHNDSDQDTGKPQEKVFDSDEDSDSEVSKHMSKDRKKVLDYVNESIDSELLAVKTCSSKKVEAIMEMRPFKSWDDMVKRIKNHKQLSTDLLNHCQNLLVRRNNLATIMKKCTKIVERLESAVAKGAGVAKQPALLNPAMKLADYQMVGLNWLAVLHKEETNGILADEMGLGKTIQVISFLAYLKESGFSKNPHLIVVPSSTLDNWDQELAKWCPDIKVAKYYGSSDERRSLRIQWSRGGLKGIDVVLTTYRQVTSTPEERKMFRVTPIDYVIFDEAHMLKNMTTQRYAHLIRINAEKRILLTGTPLQNNLLELMSLLCFVMPSLFAGNADDIKSLFEKKIKAKNDTSSGDTTLFEQTQIAQAKKIMKPFVLRRLKTDVLKCLPLKTNELIKLKLTGQHEERYKDLVHCYSSESGIVKATNELSGMSIMMDMRKLASHPLLMRYYYSDADLRKMGKRLAKDSTYKGVNPDHIFDDLAILSDFKLYQMVQKHPSLKGLEIPKDLILESTKFVELDRLLPILKEEGHRVLIFSQFTMMLDILEEYLILRDHGYMRLDGQTPVTDRQDMIDEYTKDSDYFVFLLSTKAGGLGINLTAADTVILHDIDFNPYNDKQAEDRCHRMGQKKPVKIYKLIIEGTIEEGMFMVAQEKLNLEKEVTNEGVDEVKEHKCMVRLLTMALGMDSHLAENMLLPTPKKNVEKPSNVVKEEEEEEEDY